jgi:hypothetical protein
MQNVEWAVIPANAGIHFDFVAWRTKMDSRLRGNDD